MTAVDYPLPVWRSLASGNYNNSDRREALDRGVNISSPTEISYKLFEEKNESTPNAYLFVMFVKLPNWKSNDDRESTPEIRTLRNLKNGIEVYRVKAALELSTGLPAHITSLLDAKDKKFSDEARLVIGENIRNGNSLRLQVLSAWEDVVKAAWTDNLDDLSAYLPSKNTKQDKSLTSPEYEKLASVVGKSENEHAFCALFTAAARGNLDICKNVLEAGYDPNQATFFGNTALHSAAFNGQFEVIQLLISHGANIRCINSQKKTPLDLAASRSFIDCARWLWLNQWSVNVPVKSGENPNVELSKSHSYPSPAKPLKDCSTLFTKPDKPTLPPVEMVKPQSSTHAKLSPGHYDVTKASERPTSSPLSWKINKAGNKVFFSKNEKNKRSEAFRVYAETKRPFTAVAKKGDGDLSPRLLPQISASLARGRSIPSVQESRLHSHTMAHLRVDIRTRSVVKPLAVDMSLNRHWINPVQNLTPNDNTSKEPPKSFNRNDDWGLVSPSKPHFSSRGLPFTNQNSSKETDKVKWQQLENETKEDRISKVEDVITTQNNDVENVKPEIDIKVNFVSLQSETSVPLIKEEIKFLEKQTFFKKNDATEHRNLETTKNISEKQDGNTGNHLHTTKLEKSAFTEKTLQNTLDSYDSLHGDSNSNQRSVNVPNKEKKLRPNSVFRDHNVHKEAVERPATTPLAPKPQTKPPQPVKEKVYERYKREGNTADSKQKQSLTRDQVIRKERNKTAWMEWMAAKHKNEVMHKKKMEETKKQNDHAVRKWGMTFEEWLDEKRKEPNKKADETEVTKTTVKRPITANSGKTFEEWLKEKKEDKPRDIKSTAKMSEEDIKKADEARQRSFALWSAKKLEDAKKEKQKREMEEEEKRNSLTIMHENWRSKERVMPFEAWKKKKENARKLKMVDEAQREEKEYLAVWAAEKRREDAEKAFRKWMNKKHSVLLKEAETELEEAKQKREDTEKKMKIRRAMLRAKVLLRWEKMSQNSRKQHRRKSSRLDSTSLSTGDIADVTNEVNIREFPKPHSEDEEENFKQNSNYHKFASVVANLDLKTSKPFKANFNDALKASYIEEDKAKDTATPASVGAETSSGSSSSDSDASKKSNDQKRTKARKKIKTKTKKIANKNINKPINKAADEDASTLILVKTDQKFSKKESSKSTLHLLEKQAKAEKQKLESKKSAVQLKRKKSVLTATKTSKTNNQLENFSSPYTTSLDHNKNTTKRKSSTQETKHSNVRQSQSTKSGNKQRVFSEEAKDKETIVKTPTATQAKKHESVNKKQTKEQKPLAIFNQKNITDNNKSTNQAKDDEDPHKVLPQNLDHINALGQTKSKEKSVADQVPLKHPTSSSSKENLHDFAAHISEKNTSPVDVEGKHSSSESFLPADGKRQMQTESKPPSKTITSTAEIFEKKAGIRSNAGAENKPDLNVETKKISDETKATSKTADNVNRPTASDGVQVVTKNKIKPENNNSALINANKSYQSLSSELQKLQPGFPKTKSVSKSNQIQKRTPNTGKSEKNEAGAIADRTEPGSISVNFVGKDNLKESKKKKNAKPKMSTDDKEKVIRKQNFVEENESQKTGPHKVQKHSQLDHKDIVKENSSKKKQLPEDDKAEKRSKASIKNSKEIPVNLNQPHPVSSKENHSLKSEKRKKFVDSARNAIEKDQNFVLEPKSVDKTFNFNNPKMNVKTTKSEIPPKIIDDAPTANQVNSFVADVPDNKESHIEDKVKSSSNATSSNKEVEERKKERRFGVQRAEDNSSPFPNHNEVLVSPVLNEDLSLQQQLGSNDQMQSNFESALNIHNKLTAKENKLETDKVTVPLNAEIVVSNSHEKETENSKAEDATLPKEIKSKNAEKQKVSLNSEIAVSNSHDKVNENVKAEEVTPPTEINSKNKENPKLVQNLSKEKSPHRQSSVKKSAPNEHPSDETSTNPFNQTQKPSHEFPSYSLVQAALDFIKAEENKESISPESSDKIKRKITIEMPVAHMDEDSDGSNS